jgi:hypothetical protein
VDKAIEIGSCFGVERFEGTCDYDYLVSVRSAIMEQNGRFVELAYIQKMIDQLETV